MKYLKFRSFLITTISLSVLLVGGCGDGDGGPPLEQTTRVEKVIGPEGGTVEVTDPSSEIYGVKVEIPAGALAEETTIIIEETRYAPSLPTGLTSGNPIVNLSPDTPFLKDIEITFPIQNIPNGDEEILCGFYWDTDNANWIVVPPEQINDNEMIIKTNHISLWRWGTVLLNEVETETVTAWMEDMFDDWSQLQTIVEDQLEPFTSAIQDWENWVYCDNQDAILSLLDFMAQGAEERIAEYLESVWDVCKICDSENVCVNCDARELIIGQPVEWLEIEIEIYMTELQLSEVLGEILGKMVAWVQYEEAIHSLGCDYRCILENGNFDFYTDLLVGNISMFSIFAIVLYQSNNPCY